ncbi:hypothetical protein BGZ61DRAFT_522982 [Ilyonectria robusta]|uniref:uncharacterized protein n=1 Tax=Ilyonectria robusta TaxID=1079257 RepID=UPI001E8DE3AA|nr:uncharacterized protein BGZ61DRAFT_522982 [Ilyonectria robusta]KAH8663291.1 hypothetical protein BGZ61DRAFT_522982 [Ilyonectria robusta]
MSSTLNHANDTYMPSDMADMSLMDFDYPEYQEFNFDELTAPEPAIAPNDLANMLLMDFGYPEDQELNLNVAGPAEPVASARQHLARPILGHQCIECKESFSTKTALDLHGSQLGHSPFACTCGGRFSRSDVLARHVKSKEVGQPQYPCHFCNRHQGEAAFRRRDHLTQHLVQYHKHDLASNIQAPPSGFASVPTCPHLECFPSQWSFTTNAGYYRHMRSVHQETPFECTVPNCDRVGAKGYFREKDLSNHCRSKHADTELQ